MNTWCENLNKEPANGTTASELFSLKLLYENTKHSASHRFIFISSVARRRQKEERKKRAIARYATAFNKLKRTRRARQTRDLPLSLFQMKSFRVPLSFLLFFKLMKTLAFVSRPPLLTPFHGPWRTLPLMGHRRRRRRLGVLLNTVKDSGKR